MTQNSKIRADEVRAGDTIEPASGWAAWDGPNTVQEVADLRSLIWLGYDNGKSTSHPRDFPFVRKAAR